MYFSTETQNIKENFKMHVEIFCISNTFMIISLDTWQVLLPSMTVVGNIPVKIMINREPL